MKFKYLLEIGNTKTTCKNGTVLDWYIKDILNRGVKNMKNIKITIIAPTTQNHYDDYTTLIAKDKEKA